MTQMENNISKNTAHDNGTDTIKNPPFSSFFFALSFLTRFSCPAVQPDEKIWRKSVFYFPLIGMILGITAGAFPVLASWYLEGLQGLVLFFSVVYVGLLELQTRFLHLDGFCDCFDGFYAMADSPEKRLSIMKDPHIGSAALGGAILLISAKVLAVYLLFMRLAIFEEYALLAISLILIPATARYAMVCAAAIGKYPREQGTGKPLIGRIPFAGGILLPGIILGFLIFTGFGIVGTFRSLFPLSGGWQAFTSGFSGIGYILQKNPAHWFIIIGNGGLALFLFALTCYFPVSFWHKKSMKKIGGTTGDVLGAVCETSELLAMVAVLTVADRLTFI